MLEIKNLSAESLDSGKVILENVNLKLSSGKIYVLVGKNGSGKSTLASVVMGSPRYKIASGDLSFNKKKILSMPPDKRARMGIYVSFQFPPEIEGVSFFNFIREAYNSSKRKKISMLKFQEILRKKSEELGIDSKLLEKYVNESFSGGEKKKFEVLQALVLDPRLVIFDEIDSGLDADSLKAISLQIKKLSKKGRTILLITHYKKILEYLKPDAVFVMDRGKIVLQGGKELVDKIDAEGYKWIKKQ